MKQDSARYLDRHSPPHISTLIALTALSAMVMSIFLPSLPGMTAYFETEYWLMQMSVTVYLASSGVMQLLIGPLADKFGRRPVLLWGIALFVLATLGCIFAPNTQIFLICRIMQAVVVVCMVLGRAVVSDLYAQNRAASVIGYVTMGTAVVPMIAPAIGGTLDVLFDWRASFWLLVILGLLIFFVTWRDLGETSQASGLTLGQQIRKYPELLCSRRFWGYALTCAFASGAFFAYLGGAPYVGTEVFGLSAVALGVYFGAPAVGYFLGNFLTGRYAAKLGLNKMLLWGALINTLGVGASLILFLLGWGTALTFFAFMTLVGLGNGLVVPNASAAMLAVRPHLAGTASGLGGAIMLLGGSALGALVGVLLVPGSGAYPLLWLMLVTSSLAVLAISITIRRETRLSQ